MSVGVSTFAEAGFLSSKGGRSRGGRSSRNSNRTKSDSLKNDGRTSGIGREIGGAIGGHFGGIAGEHIGRNIGDRLEKNGNRHAHDKWNSRGRKGHSGWRFSLNEEEY